MSKEFDFGEELFPKKPKQEDLGLEDLFEEEESKESEKNNPGKTNYTDVHEILRGTRREEKPKESKLADVPEWEFEEPETLEIPDIRELIKGPRAREKPEKKSEEEKEEDHIDEFDPKDFLKKGE